MKKLLYFEQSFKNQVNIHFSVIARSVLMIKLSFIDTLKPDYDIIGPYHCIKFINESLTCEMIGYLEQNIDIKDFVNYRQFFQVPPLYLFFNTQMRNSI